MLKNLKVMSISPQHSIHHYWSNDPMFENNWIKNTKMTRKRWQQINVNFHFDIDWILEKYTRGFEV